MVSLTDLKGSNLTEPRGDEFRSAMGATRAGMAHFAGTGPAGTACGGCTFFKGAICLKYRELMRGSKIKSRGGIPASTPSCRHFEQSAKPQEPVYSTKW